MAFSLFDSKGVDVRHQRFSWRELVQQPISKLDDDAFTRVRIILAGALEAEALRFGHMAAHCHPALRLPLALVRRTEQHQASLVNALLGADHSPLETTIACEQAAIEVTAAVAQDEPSPYLAQVYRFGLLEHVDHLFRFAALLDRLEGKDANVILQSHTDVLPGRPAGEQHRAPEDDLREPYQRASAAPLSKLHALTMLAVAAHTRGHLMHAGPLCADPLARQLYAEIASIGEQHLTAYGSLPDPAETWLEQWVLHEANECHIYYSCVEHEDDYRARALWERFLEYELGHFHMACAALKQFEKRDPAAIIDGHFAAPLALRSQRAFVRQVLAAEVDLRARGTGFGAIGEQGDATILYRTFVNTHGSPSEAVGAGYAWMPGTELARPATPADRGPARH